MTLPEWVQKHKQKGTEIRTHNNTYYLYKITSKYDPKIKRSRKITQQYLGKITPQGLTKPKPQTLKENLQQITTKEYAATNLILTQCQDIIKHLQHHYPQQWQQITTFAIARLFHQSPLKNIQTHYQTSHLSDALPNTQVSPETLSKLLHDIGQRRQTMTQFMQNFQTGDQIIIDLTHIFSLSEGVISATLGHNHQKQYLPQINLILLLSLEKKTPSFFRLVSGSIRDVSTVVNSVKEAQLKEALLIGDKGFYSEANLLALEDKSVNVQYVLPLKRNSVLISYAPMRSGDREVFDGCFQFDKRVIWFKEQKLELEQGSGGRRVILFLDEFLRVEEEKDFVSYAVKSAEKKKVELDLSGFFGRQFCMGTIAVVTNCGFGAQRVFELLKERVEVEQVFDVFKNTLCADRSFMRDDWGLQGWMFVNFVALLFYYRLYDLLLGCDVLSKYSVEDVVLHFSRVFKLKIGDKWVLSEIPKSSRILAEKLKVKISIT